MASEPNIARIMVQLDALLDTRLGTLARINPDGVEPLIRAGYCDRKIDSFAGYDSTLYKQMYETRDIETLMSSVETGVFLFLRQMVDMLDEQTIVRPYHTGVEVVVNCYPYLLSEENKVTIANTVDYWIKGMAPVKVVTIADKDLTPELCKGQFSAMIMYHFAEWFKMHVQTMVVTRLIDITLYVPDLLASANENTYQDDLEKFTKTIAPPELALDWLSKMLIGLQIVKVKLFSIADINQNALASQTPANMGDGEAKDSA